MRKLQIVLLVLLIAVVTLGLAGCKRSATDETEASEDAGLLFTPTSMGSFPAVSQQPSIGEIFSSTQTAMAKSQGTPTPQSLTPDAPDGPAEPGQETPAGEGQQEGGSEATPGPTANITITEPPPPVEATPGRPETWSLHEGEWPICIARRYNLDLETFFSANGLAMDSRPPVGTELKIPATGEWSANYGPRALKDHPTTYTVITGDSIYSIACKFGDVDPNAIISTNSLEEPVVLSGGQTLQIP